ncbi:hypothetical protein [Microscilla marina]|uniref:Co-chaperone DjlA N-terminal domain-containing protein n=1 Tax=Microscilla marina ATCC 23134 TaxID=313606 RepID=A1ZXX3_MICM2|nr:hypothetical protein [Microscilla marina]EAY24802.1 hypothetical protein M23134_04585 [Microscilla marina ATCC 23134]
MQELTLEERDIYRAIGELAYVIATVDNVLSKSEKVVFTEAVKEDLGRNSWLALDRFEQLENEQIDHNLDATYNRVLFVIRKNKDVLTEDHIEKFISVLEKVAGVSGVSEEELAIINQFQVDVKRIYKQNNS